MKQIGAGDRRQRVARVAAARARHPPPARSARRRDGAGQAAGRVPVDRAAVPAEAGDAEGAISRRAAAQPHRAGVVVPYASTSRAARSKSPSRNGLAQPAAAALVEEALRVGADDVAGDEDQPRAPAPAPSRRWRGRTPSVEPRHLQVADHQRRRGARRTRRERLFAVARAIDHEPRIRQRIATAAGERRLVLHHAARGARARLGRHRLAPAPRPLAPAWSTSTGSSTRNDAPRRGADCDADRVRRAPGRSRRRPSGRGRCPCRLPSS